MTLDTRVYVLDQVDHRELFAKCGQLIGSHEGIAFTDEQDKTWSKGVGAAEPGNPWTIGNKVGQGLCALLDVAYRPACPLRAAGQHKEWCEEDDGCEGGSYCTPCWSEVSFDTAYSYREGGEGCGDLHARLVAELGQWLDAKGIRWQWKNEFTGDIFDRYDGLTELGSGGAEASDWFRNIAAPAIAAHIAGGAR